MIQRIQTLFMLLTAGIMACFTFLNIGQLQTADNTWFISAMCLQTQNAANEIVTWHTFIVSALAALIPFVAIFMYRRQRLQKKLCYITIMFCLAIYAMVAYEGYFLIEGTTATSWSGTVVGPLLAICLCMLSVKYINKDIKLLSSYDRLR